MKLGVTALERVDDRVVEAFDRLTRQLSSSAVPPDADEIRRVIECDTNTVLLAHRGEDIVGMLTLVVFPIPTGIRAHIEDVVVDASARGQGVGATLTTEAVRRAQLAGARSVDLTSRPSRVAANRLYQRLGFTLRESNVYRYNEPLASPGS